MRFAPCTVLLFGTVQVPPPVITNSVASQLAVAVIVDATAVTTRNSGVNPGARVDTGSSIATTPELAIDRL